MIIFFSLHQRSERCSYRNPFLLLNFVIVYLSYPWKAKRKMISTQLFQWNYSPFVLSVQLFSCNYRLWSGAPEIKISEQTILNKPMDLSIISNSTVRNAQPHCKTMILTTGILFFTDNVVFTDDCNTFKFQILLIMHLLKKRNIWSIDKVEDDGKSVYGQFYVANGDLQCVFQISCPIRMENL